MTLDLSSYKYVFIAITYTNSYTYGVVINVKTGELSESECILLCKITKSTFYRYIQEISMEYHIPILRDESNHIILSQKEIVDKIKKGA